MLTRRQVLTKASLGVAVGIAGGFASDVAVAADDRQAVGPTLFTSVRPPSVELTVPDGWYVRSDVLQGMDVPWGLAFASSEYVAYGSDSNGEWDDLVSSALGPRGLAIAVVALDRLIPASSWLRPSATRELTSVGADVGPSVPVGRPLSRGVTFADLGSLTVADADKATPYMGWFDQDHYLVGVQAWLGTEASQSQLEAVLATIQP